MSTESSLTRTAPGEGRSFHGLTSFQLKLIACISMLIDHATVILYYNGYLPNNGIYFYGGSLWSDPYFRLGLSLRFIGRFAFPIYAFLMSEGYLHTRNKRNYLLRLGVFALISEIPFDLGFFGGFPFPAQQNVFFTLFLGLSAIALWDMITTRLTIPSAFRLGAGALAVTAMYGLAQWASTDYGGAGVLLIFAFYVLRTRPFLRDASILLFASQFGGVEYGAIVAAVFLHLYNGKLGCRSRAMQIAFYVYYPAHILLLVLLQNLIW